MHTSPEKSLAMQYADQYTDGKTFELVTKAWLAGYKAGGGVVSFDLPCTHEWIPFDGIQYNGSTFYCKHCKAED